MFPHTRVQGSFETRSSSWGCDCGEGGEGLQKETQFDSLSSSELNPVHSTLFYCLPNLPSVPSGNWRAKKAVEVKQLAERSF